MPRQQKRPPQPDAYRSHSPVAQHDNAMSAKRRQPHYGICSQCQGYTWNVTSVMASQCSVRVLGRVRHQVLLAAPLTGVPRTVERERQTCSESLALLFIFGIIYVCVLGASEYFGGLRNIGGELSLLAVTVRSRRLSGMRSLFGSGVAVLIVGSVSRSRSIISSPCLVAAATLRSTFKDCAGRVTRGSVTGSRRSKSRYSMVTRQQKSHAHRVRQKYAQAVPTLNLSVGRPGKTRVWITRRGEEIAVALVIAHAGMLVSRHQSPGN